MNLKGIWVFDQWAQGLLTWTGTASLNTPNNIAGAVQLAIWLSEGYTETSNNLHSKLGLTTSQYSPFESQVSSWEAGFPVGWTPDADKIVYLKNTATGAASQDQMFLVSAVPLQNVPEPASIIVWSLMGLSASGVVAARRRRGIQAVGRKKIAKRFPP